MQYQIEIALFYKSLGISGAVLCPGMPETSSPGCIVVATTNDNYIVLLALVYKVSKVMAFI